MFWELDNNSAFARTEYYLPLYVGQRINVGFSARAAFGRTGCRVHSHSRFLIRIPPRPISSSFLRVAELEPDGSDRDQPKLLIGWEQQINCAVNYTFRLPQRYREEGECVSQRSQTRCRVSLAPDTRVSWFAFPV